LLNLLGFVCHNKIRDYVRGKEGSKDKEVSREVRVEERGDDNNERRDIKGGDAGDRGSKGIADFIIVLLISSPPSPLSSSILSEQLAKLPRRPSLIRCKRARYS
jgi:hypothetical protein